MSEIMDYGPTGTEETRKVSNQAGEIEYRKEGNRYIAVNGNGQIGQIDYRLADPGLWVIDRTYVDPDYRGRTVASDLVRLVVEDAREMGRKIKPVCPYAFSQFSKTPEYADVWEK